MQFGYVILYVQDLLASVEFYERAFGFSRRMVHEEQYAELETGATRLAFVARSAIEAMLPLSCGEAKAAPPPMELGLVAGEDGEAVRSAYERALAAGAAPVCPPQAKPWGQVVAYVRDQEGFLVELCSSLG